MYSAALIIQELQSFLIHTAAMPVKGKNALQISAEVDIKLL